LELSRRGDSNAPPVFSQWMDGNKVSVEGNKKSADSSDQAHRFTIG
jgi:hypothetical protein